MNFGSSKSSGGNAIVWIVLAGVAIIIGGFLIGLLAPSLLPAQASTQARQVDSLFQFMLVIAGIVFLLVEGVLLYSVLRFRAKPGDTSDGPPIHGNTTLEFVWTMIPALVVIAITIYSYQVWQDTRAIQPNEQQVHIIGQRYAWTFQYQFTKNDLPEDIAFESLNPDIQERLENGGMTINYPQLVTWVNHPVYARMTADDVNHAFWVPAMRVKQDLLPGRETDIRFTPIEANVYRVVCAELCGSGHGDMAGTIGANGELLGAWVVVYPDESTFRREFWEPEIRNLVIPPEDPVQLGRQILVSGQYPCATCHVLGDLNWQGTIGPSLDGISTRTQRLTQSGSSTMEEYLHDSIRHSQQFLVPGYGALMPDFNADASMPNYMPEPDLQAIIAYLLTQ